MTKNRQNGSATRVLILLTLAAVIAFVLFSQTNAARQLRRGAEEALHYGMNLDIGLRKAAELLGISENTETLSVSAKPAGLYARPTDGAILPYDPEKRCLTATCGRFYNVFAVYAGEISAVRRTGDTWRITVRQQDGCEAVYDGCGMPLLQAHAKVQTGKALAMAPETGRITLALFCGGEAINPADYFA